MATTYPVDILNAEGTKVVESGQLNFTSTTNQPVGSANAITSGTLPNTGAWVSGTAKVNPVARPVTVVVEVVSDGTNNAGTCAIDVSPDNSTFTTVGTVAVPAGVNNLGVVKEVVPVNLPNGWYIKLTFTATRITVAASIYYQMHGEGDLHDEGNLLKVEWPYWTQGERNENWPLNKSSIAYAAGLVVKTGPGKLYGFTVYNSGAAQFILLFNGTVIPANGATAACVFTVGATSMLPAWFGDTGRSFDAGCVLVNSSTSPTLTIGAADCFFDVQYL